MKKILSMIILWCVLTCFVGCDDINTKQNQQLVVFAASSLTDVLTETKEIYNMHNKDVEIIFNFDSSGTLKKQIEEGAKCDVFISANKTTIDSLDCVEIIDKFDFLENKVVLVVADNNISITSFEDMVRYLNNKNLFMAIGNEDVPVGEYTNKIFDYYNLDKDVLNTNGLLTYCSNAKEVVASVSEGLVDCAIVYKTDADNNGLKIVDTATEDMCGKVVYSAAILENSDNYIAANEFRAFLGTNEVKDVFRDFGFTVLI